MHYSVSADSAEFSINNLAEEFLQILLTTLLSWDTRVEMGIEQESDSTLFTLENSIVRAQSIDPSAVV